MKKLLFMLAAFALTATSCSKEEVTEGPNTPGGNDGGEVIGTNNNLTLRLNAAASGNSANHSDQERLVTTLTAYVFDASNGLLELQKTFNAGNLPQPAPAADAETPKDMTGEELTINSQKKMSLTSVSLPVSVGKKQVIVLANYNTYPTAEPAVTTYATFKAATENLFDNDQTKNEYGIITAEGFTMSGENPDVQVETGATKEITIKLTRYAAKVSIEKPTTAVDGDLGTFQMSTGEGKTGGVRRGNVAKSFYRFLKYSENTSKWEIPANVEYYTADFTKTNDYNSVDYVKYFTENKPAAVSGGDNGNGVSQKSTSYVIVKGNFTPKKNMYNASGKPCKINNADWSSESDKGTENWTTGSDFWRIAIKDATGNRVSWHNAAFYQAEPTSIAESLQSSLAENGQTAQIVKYEQAVCYYRIWITNNMNGLNVSDPYYHAIRRNQWFKINMTKVTDCGMNDEQGTTAGDPVEPEKPVEPTQGLNVTITVKDWSVVGQNTPLG